MHEVFSPSTFEVGITTAAFKRVLRRDMRRGVLMPWLLFLRWRKKSLPTFSRSYALGGAVEERRIFFETSQVRRSHIAQAKEKKEEGGADFNKPSPL